MTQSNITFRQGDDVVLSIMPDADLTAASKIKAVLYVGAREQYKYSSDNETGYGKLVFDTVNKKIDLYVERAHSATFDVGQVRAYTLYNLDNVEFPDGAETKTFETTVGRVIAGRALDIDI